MAKYNHFPFHEHVIVKRDAVKKKIGMIDIPDDIADKDKPSEGVVLAIGTGYRTPTGIIPLEVKVGDRVLFGKYSGNDHLMNGDPVCILKEDELLSRMELMPGEVEDKPVEEAQIVKVIGIDRFKLIDEQTAKYHKDGYNRYATEGRIHDLNRNFNEPELTKSEITIIIDSVFKED